jgi:hypothetical protein
MKTIKIVTGFLLAMILSGQVMAKQAGEQKDQLVVPLSDPSKPFKLHVDLINGSIKVVGYEGKDIVIDVASGADDKARSRGESLNGMKRITGGAGMDVSAEEKNNSVVVRADSWKGAVRLVIKVPQLEAKIKLSTTNQGDIVVSNVSGELEISNLNGDIQLNNISGSAIANSLNGDIMASFKTIDPKAMAFSTFNGKIDVTFPATLKANVKLKSDQGEIYSDFDVEAKIQPEANKSSSSGVYRIKIDNTVYGKINGGGPELMMKNMHGNIYIRKPKI